MHHRFDTLSSNRPREKGNRRRTTAGHRIVSVTPTNATHSAHRGCTYRASSHQNSLRWPASRHKTGTKATQTCPTPPPQAWPRGRGWSGHLQLEGRLGTVVFTKPLRPTHPDPTMDMVSHLDAPGQVEEEHRRREVQHHGLEVESQREQKGPHPVTTCHAYPPAWEHGERGVCTHQCHMRAPPTHRDAPQPRWRAPAPG